MNERIRELQSKSYLMCKQIVDDDGHIVVTPDKWFDKFAELIVKDAIDGLLDTYGPDDCLPQEEIAGFLKEHFGVE